MRARRSWQRGGDRLRRVITSARLTAGLAAALALPAVWWLARRDDFFSSHDGDLHLWRIWEFWQVWRAGQAPVRWGPDVSYGFGSPLFTYYGPLAYLLGGVAQAWGLGAADAARLVYALALALAAAGMYLLAAEWYAGRAGQRWASPLAAVAYLYAPYVLVNASVRGAMGELLALGIAPWLLWAELRSLRRRDLPSLLALALAVAALALAHNLSAVVFALAALAVALHWLAVHRLAWATRLAALGTLELAVALGVALVTFYWAPALGELSYVHVERAIGPVEEPRYAAAFIPPALLVQPLPIHDYRLDFTRGATWPHLGLAQSAALAAAALALALRRRSRQALDLLPLVGVGAALLMVTPLSAPVWQHLPYLPTLQFPWRLLGLVAFFGAILVGGLATLPRGALVALVASAALVVGGSRVSVLPRQWLADWEGPAVLAEFERGTQAVGLTTDEEFFPRWVDRTRWTLFDPREASGAGSAAAPLEVSLLDAQPTRWKLTVVAGERATLMLDTFYFPTWQATIDSRLAAVRPDGPLGLLAVDVPPGRHSVEVSRVDTPLETAADRVSGAGLVALAALLALAWVRATPRGRAMGALAVGVLAVACAPFLLPVARLDRSARYVPAPEVRAGPVQLLGTRVEQSRLASTGKVDVTLLALTPGPGASEEPKVTARLTGPAGDPVAESAHRLGQGLRPITIWQPNLILGDRFELFLPPGTEEGDYTLSVALGDGPPQNAGEFRLGRSGARSASPPEVPSLAAWPSVRWGKHLVLDWHALEPELPAGAKALVAGQSVAYRGELAWTRISGSEGGYEAVLDLVDARGQVRQEFVLPVVFPPGRTRLLQPVRISLAPDVAPGRYRIALRVRAESGEWLRRQVGERPGIEADALELRADDFLPACDCLPTLATAQPVELGDGMRLLGYERRVVGDALDVVTYWQAGGVPKQGYTVYLHLLDRDGRRVDQFDGIPFDGGRPTPSWRPGEVVPFAARLRLPAQGGPFRLRTGLYESVGLRPLEARDGRREIALGLVERGQPPSGQAIEFDGGVRLLGYRLEREPDQAVVVLYWQTSRPVDGRYSVFVHALDSTGRIVAQGDGPPELGERTTADWPPGEVIVDPHRFAAPAGPARLRVGLYRLDDGRRLALAGGGDFVDLGEPDPR